MEGYIGEIRMFGANFAPRAWALCQGQLLSISQNPSLFSIIGTMYGGDGVTTFGLPDLRGRSAIGSGQGPGLNNIMQGQKLGTQSNTLNETQLPSHTHGATSVANASTADGESTEPSGNLWAGGGAASKVYNAPTTPTAPMAGNAVTTTVANTGGGQPVNNRAPETAVNYIICLQGIFPSRN